MGPAASATPKPAAPAASPTPQVPLQILPEPTALALAPQPTVISPEREGPTSGQQKMPPTDEAGPTQTPAVSVGTGPELVSEGPDPAATDLDRKEAGAPAPQEKSSPTSPPSAAETGGQVIPDSEPELPVITDGEQALEAHRPDVAESKETPESLVLLPWIFGGVAVSIILAILLVIRLKKFRAGRSPD